MHGCGWDSGAARERSSALAASVASRVTRSAPMAWALRKEARRARAQPPRAQLEGGGACPTRTLGNHAENS